MARLFMDGAEHPIGDTSLWSPTQSRFTVSSTVKRGGAYSYRVDSYKGIGGSSGYASRSFTGTSEIFIRFGFYTGVHFTSTAFFQLRNSTTTLIGLGLSGTNFRVLVGGAVVATGTFVYSLNTQYLIKMRAKIDNSVGVVQVKIEGVLDINYSGDTQPGAATTIDNIYLYADSNDAAQNISPQPFYIDDIFINDTTGAVDNSWPSDGYIVYQQKPNGAGDVTQLTPNTGANYAAVDEVPHDGDTTYVEGGTLDTYDLYNVANSTLPAGATILRAQVVAVAKDTVANGGKIALGVKTGGTEYWSDDITLTTTYKAVEGDDHRVNPNTSVAWTIENINDVQIGAKVRGT